MRILLSLFFILTVDFTLAQVVPVTLYYTNDRLITMPGNHAIVRYSAVDTVAGHFSGSFKDEYPDGRKIIEGAYKNGELNGALTAYYPNGVPYANGRYLNGRKYGIWRYYFTDGKPMEVVEFDSSGLFVIWTAFDADGRQTVTKGTGKWTKLMETNPRPDYILKTEFKNGKREGRWVFKSKYGHSYHVEKYKEGELKNTNDRYVKKTKDSLFSTIDDRLFAFGPLQKAGKFAVTMYAARHYPALESVLKEATNEGSAPSYAFPDSLLITLDLHAYVNGRLNGLTDNPNAEYEGVMKVGVNRSMDMIPEPEYSRGSVPSVEKGLAEVIRNAPPLVRSDYNFRPGLEFFLYYRYEKGKSPYAFIFFSREELEAYVARVSKEG
ncbi:toxin-antitoxin system YwqK family antitoxin [Roseivirga sp. BDSF3-8]|uniref:toxin-antitoxin system YwqK family antitoxin n=1 Tax=Roseivirga sp. BDSF3-8 TaxID=3241598 RepID=UPI0035327240